MPFRNPNELMNVPGMPPGVMQQASGTFTTRSLTFEIMVDAAHWTVPPQIHRELCAETQPPATS